MPLDSAPTLLGPSPGKEHQGKFYMQKILRQQFGSRDGLGRTQTSDRRTRHSTASQWIHTRLVIRWERAYDVQPRENGDASVFQ